MGQELTPEMGMECPVVAGRPTPHIRACPSQECRRGRCQEVKTADIEVLACIAARLAGQDPDRETSIKFGEIVAFDDKVWRYPDFLARAEAAYRILASDDYPE